MVAQKAVGFEQVLLEVHKKILFIIKLLKRGVEVGVLLMLKTMHFFHTSGSLFPSSILVFCASASIIWWLLTECIRWEQAPEAHLGGFHLHCKGAWV